jgi:hypothetical protein
MNDPLSVVESLRDFYVRYCETPFAIRDPAVAAEPHQLLLEDKTIAREPWLEPLGEIEVMSVNRGPAGAADSADVLIVGGPTHMHGLATSMSRKQAA